MSRINVGSDVVRLSFIMVLTCRTGRYVARGSCVTAPLRWPCIFIVLLCDSHSAFPVDSELEHPRLHRLGLDASSSTQVPLRLRSRLRRRPGAAWSSLFLGSIFKFID